MDKILACAVDPYMPYMNEPRINVIVDGLTDWNQLVFDTKDDFYLNVQGDMGHFIYTDGVPCDGFGGARITMKLRDGTTKTVIGAWSSRPDCVKEAMGVDLINASVNIKGSGPYAWIAMAITAEAAERMIPPEWEIKRFPNQACRIQHRELGPKRLDPNPAKININLCYNELPKFDYKAFVEGFEASVE